MRKLFEKLQLKGFITGVLVTLVLSGTVLVAANTQTVSRTLTYGVGVIFNGQPVQFDYDSRPFIIDGRTFLPLRAIAALMELPVAFDSEANMAIIGSSMPQPAPQPPPIATEPIATSPPPPATEPVTAPTEAPTQPQVVNPRQSILGRDYEAFRLTNVWAFDRNNLGRMMGAEYEYGFAKNINNASGSAFFNTNGRYATMSGLFGPLDNVERTNAITLYIIGDGRTIDSFIMHHNNPVREFTVNIAGVSQLEFRFTGGQGRFGIANVSLSETNHASTSFNRPIGNFSNQIVLGRELNAFRLVNVWPFALGQMGRIMGVEYEYGFAKNINNASGSAFFNINGQYSTITGIMGPLDNVDRNNTITLHIIGDGRTIETFEIRSTDPARQFTANVTGVSQLELRFTGGQGRFGVANVTLN